VPHVPASAVQRLKRWQPSELAQSSCRAMHIPSTARQRPFTKQPSVGAQCASAVAAHWPSFSPHAPFAAQSGRAAQISAVARQSSPACAQRPCVSQPTARRQSSALVATQRPPRPVQRPCSLHSSLQLSARRSSQPETPKQSKMSHKPAEPRVTPRTVALPRHNARPFRLRLSERPAETCAAVATGSGASADAPVPFGSPPRRRSVKRATARFARVSQFRPASAGRWSQTSMRPLPTARLLTPDLQKPHPE
jgi:hypothetical protein